MSVCYDKLGTCSNLQPLAVLKRVSVACSNTHSRAGLGNSTMAKEWAKKKVSMSILYSNLTVNRFHWSCFLRKKFPKWHQIEALLWKVVSTTGTSMFTYSETFLSLTYKTRLICIVRLCKCPRQMKKKLLEFCFGVFIYSKQWQTSKWCRVCFFCNFQDLDFLRRVFQCSVKVSRLVQPGAAVLRRNSAEWAFHI